MWHDSHPVWAASLIALGFAIVVGNLWLLSGPHTVDAPPTAASLGGEGTEYVHGP